MSSGLSRGCSHQAVGSLWDPRAGVTPSALRAVREEREGAWLGLYSEWLRDPVLFLLVLLRLIREQLLEGDFTINMRLLQVTEFGGPSSVLTIRQILTRDPPHVSHCDRLESRAVEYSRA